MKALSKQTTLRVVCSWCRKSMGTKPGYGATGISHGMCSSCARKQMEALTLYFSEQKWPTIQTASSDQQIAIGERIGTSGQCTQCHLGGYNGVSGTPQLAGQTPEYLEKTMLDFKYRRRKNAPDKSVLIDSYSDEDLAAMAHYLAGF